MNPNTQTTNDDNLCYPKSLEDAKKMLGDVANISRLFIEFQEHLYRQKAA